MNPATAGPAPQSGCSPMSTAAPAGAPINTGLDSRGHCVPPGSLHSGQRGLGVGWIRSILREGSAFRSDHVPFRPEVV
jgi:hypothetical protein